MGQKNILLEKMNIHKCSPILNNRPIIGLVGAPKKIDYFILMEKITSYMIENKKTIKIRL